MDAVYKWALGVLSAAFFGVFGWAWKTDRRIVRLEERVAEAEKDIAAHPSPCPDVVALRDTVAGLVEVTRMHHEELRDIWPKIDDIGKRVDKTNQSLARLEGKLE